MLFPWYWIVVFAVCGKCFSGNYLLTEFVACPNSQKYSEIKSEQVPRVESEGSTVQDVTSTFQVGFTGTNITGNITLTMNGVEGTTTFVVKLSLILNDQVDHTEYFLILDDMEETGNIHAELNCIHIPIIPNSMLKAEVYKINMMSCDCNITAMAASELHSCLHLCHMYLVSTHTFPASKDACLFYKKNDRDEIHMALEVQMKSTGLALFSGYFTNINPFSIVHVSIFPNDENLWPYIPLWTAVVNVTLEGEVNFSVCAQTLGYSHFYAKLTIPCMEGEQGNDYYSDPPTEIYDVSYEYYHYNDENKDYIDYDDDDIDDDDNYSKSMKSEMVYGIVVGLLSVCCIVTVFVWLKLYQRKRFRPQTRRNNSEEVDEEEYADDFNLQITLHTSNMCPTEYRDYQNHCKKDGLPTREKKVMLLYHPDSDKHSVAVNSLVACLEKFNVQVHGKPEIYFQNWRDFAEKVGEGYDDVIIVLSSGLIELCELYRKRKCSVGNDLVERKRWNELIGQRHGEYIPCVVLDKVRSLMQDKCCTVRTHFVTFGDTDIDEDRDKVSGNIFCDTVSMYNSSDNVSLHEHCDTVCTLHSSDTVCAHDSKDSSNHNINDINDFKDRDNFMAMHYSNNESVKLFNSQNHKDFLEFLKHHTFLDSKSTYLHTISAKVLKYFLLAESCTDIQANMQSLSLLYVLRNLK